MLDSILSTAKDYIQKEVGKNANVPKQQSSVVSDVIFNTVSSSLKKQMGGTSKSTTGGGIDLSMLGGLLGGGKNSNFLDGMSKSVVDALVKKTGMKSPVAQSIASSILPGLISAITKKAGGGALGNVAGGLLGNLFGKK